MTTLRINVPNIGSLIPTYDVIRVYRSTVSKDGPFVELTSAAASPAVLNGANTGPFIDLNGKTLILRTEDVNGVNPDVSVTFTDPNPITTLQVATAINATAFAGTAADLGFLELTSTATGSKAKIMVVGGTALADLGFSLYQQDQGEDPFIPLVVGQQDYILEDPDGSDFNWYRWNFYNTGSLASSVVTLPIHPQNAKIDPNRKIQDFRAEKGLTLVRGREHTFRMAFWEDEAAGVPLVPSNASTYPSFSIFDINGQCIAFGKAEVDGTTPNYKVLFLVPQDSVLTSDDRRWRIEWLMLTDAERQVEAIQEFDVRDVDVSATFTRDQAFIGLEDQTFRVPIRFPHEIYSLSLTITESDDTTKIIIPTTSVLTRIVDGDSIVYYYDIASNLLKSGALGKAHNIIWAIQETPASATTYEFSILEVPPSKILKFFKDLRQIIDKFQKRKGTIQAYGDPEILTYLRYGMNHINGIHPANLQFNFLTVPPVMEPYWILASVFYGLTAQQLCELDLSFSSNGQTVSLDYDRQGGLEAALNRAITTLNEGATKTKEHLYRSTSQVGSFAGRPPRLAGRNNFVYKLTTVSSQNYMTLLQQVGLL